MCNCMSIRERRRNRAILVGTLACLLAVPFLAGFLHNLSIPSAQYRDAEFGGKVLLMVPPPNYYGVPGADPNTSIERLDYVGADGVILGFEKWWDNVELYRDTLRRYQDAGFLTAGMWGHHCEYLRYCPRFNPPIHDWAIAHQHKQMAIYWRIHINSSVPVASVYEHGQIMGNLGVSQNQNGSLTVRIRSLDYYEPVYGGGVRYDVAGVYENYPASEFSWLYDESGVENDVENATQERGVRLSYGAGYELYTDSNSLHAIVYEPANRDFNLYVLFYVPSFPSPYFLEGRIAWLSTLRSFLGNFSEYMDALVQNSGGFPVPEGDFNPEIIKNLEEKYGIDFSFDNWIFDAQGPWNEKHLTQYVFGRENYFIFKEYAKEKQDILHDYGLIYVPTGSDTKHMLWAMVEHIDSLLVNSFLDSHRVIRYGWSWGTNEWAPSTLRLGIWNSYILRQYSTAEDIREWGRYTINEAMKWNPEGATMTFWTATADFDLTSEQWEALKEVTRYMHDRFKHVILLPSGVERHTVARVYRISHEYRFRPTIEINRGQIDVYPIYVKDLKWDSLPTDGCLVYDGAGGGVVDYVSQIDDTYAHDKIIQAVNDGATIAFSGNALRRIGDYYNGTNIPAMMSDMFQTESWTHNGRDGHVSHFLTFNGTFDPRRLNGSIPHGYWLKLKSNSSANIITGEFPYAGLYEAEFGKGRVIGYTRSSDPFSTLFTDENSATYGDEYSIRFFEYCGGEKVDFRLWDVGKTHVYKADESTYYAMFVERYGISRDVPIRVYGTEQVRIVDLDSNREIPNNSLIHLEANSTRLMMIKLK